MNKLLVLALSLLIGGLGGYANTKVDTTIVVNHARKVVIEKTPNGMSVNVEGSADDPNYFYSQRMEVNATDAVITEEKTTNWEFSIPVFKKKNDGGKYNSHGYELTGFGFGLVNAVKAEQGLKVDMSESYELMIDNLLHSIHYLHPRTTSVSVGFGMTWRNYRMTGNTRYIKENNGIVLGNYPEGADIKFSRLKIFSLTFPFMFNQSLGNNALFSVGPVVNFNTYGSLKTRYTLNDEKIKEKSKDIRQQKVTVDMMAKFCIRSMGFYAKYSPMDVLKTDFGPKFRSFSVGVMFIR